MASDLTGIGNHHEFYTDHYLAEILEGDLRGLQEQTRYGKVEWFGKGLRGWFPLCPLEESRVSKDLGCHWSYFYHPKVGSNPCLPVGDQSTLVYAQVQQEPAGEFVAGWITVLLFCGL